MMAPTIVSRLERLRRRTRLFRAMRASSIVSLLLTAASVLGAPPAVVGLLASAVVFSALVAAFTGPTLLELGRLVDARGGLSDAVTCAFELRGSVSPGHVAQRRAAERAFAGLTDDHLVRAPSRRWLLCLALLAVPFFLDGPLYDGFQSGPTLNAKGPGFELAFDPSTTETSRPRAVKDPMARADVEGEAAFSPNARPAAPKLAPEGATAAPSRPPPPVPEGGELPPTPQVGGIGAAAGDISAGQVQAAAVPVPTSAASEQALSVARGSGPVRGPGRSSNAGPSSQSLGAPPTDDERFTGPTRAYPPSQRPLITAYLDALAAEPRHKPYHPKMPERP